MNPTPTAAYGRGLFSIRTALLLGFGGLILLLVFSGVDALQVLSQMRSSNEKVRRDFLERADRLEEIRAGLYLSGTYIRDYLLEPDPAAADRHRASLRTTRTKIDAQLLAYQQLLRPEQKDPFAILRREFDDYWTSLDPVLSWSPAERHDRGYAFLRDEVFPRRTNMLSIAGKIAAVNEQELTAGDRALADMFTGLRFRLLIVLALTVGLGTLQAAISIRQILHLERAAAAHLEEMTEARAKLRELSAKLVETQESERKAISRELHDAVGQALSGVILELRNITALAPAATGASDLRPHLQSATRQVEGVVGMIRTMALLLRPSMLDDLGLIPALEWQARDFSKRTGIFAEVEAGEIPEDLSDEQNTCIFRIVQEALNNALKHAEPQSARIRLHSAGATISLSIEDDGRGFTPQEHRGLGLIGMQERVEKLGGEFKVDSRPGKGTLISVTLPIHSTPRPGLAV